jgi:hypothetical protein
MSFFSSLKSGAGQVLSGVSKAANVIPGIGDLVSASAAAVSATLQGGTVTTVTPKTGGGYETTVLGPEATYSGTSATNPVKAPGKDGFLDNILSFRFMGIPVALAGLGVLAFVFLGKKSRGKR